MDLFLGNYVVEENEGLTVKSPLEADRDWKYYAVSSTFIFLSVVISRSYFLISRNTFFFVVYLMLTNFCVHSLWLFLFVYVIFRYKMRIVVMLYLCYLVVMCTKCWRIHVFYVRLVYLVLVFAFLLLYTLLMIFS